MEAIRILALVLTLAVIILTGTIFFHFVEGWGWVDAYFFTVVTLSTVGYGNLVPVTTIGKIGTSIFIITGLGVFALAIQQIAQFTMKRREKHTEKMLTQLAENQANEKVDESDGGATEKE